MPKFDLDNQNKLLDGCSSTLEFFLVKHIYIFFLVTVNIIFSTLTKNALEISKLEKIVSNKTFLLPKI